VLFLFSVVLKTVVLFLSFLLLSSDFIIYMFSSQFSLVISQYLIASKFLNSSVTKSLAFLFSVICCFLRPLSSAFLSSFFSWSVRSKCCYIFLFSYFFFLSVFLLFVQFIFSWSFCKFMFIICSSVRSHFTFFQFLNIILHFLAWILHFYFFSFELYLSSLFSFVVERYPCFTCRFITQRVIHGGSRWLEQCL
jgi:hypothetical protein